MLVDPERLEKRIEVSMDELGEDLSGLKLQRSDKLGRIEGKDSDDDSLSGDREPRHPLPTIGSGNIKLPHPEYDE